MIHVMNCVTHLLLYTECAKTAAVLCGTSHVTNQTALYVCHFGGYSKCAIKSNCHSFRMSEPACEWKIARYKSNQNNKKKLFFLDKLTLLHPSAPSRFSLPLCFFCPSTTTPLSLFLFISSYVGLSTFGGGGGESCFFFSLNMCVLSPQALSETLSMLYSDNSTSVIKYF